MLIILNYTVAEKAVWRSVFLTIWHCILNADLTKTHTSSVTFFAICRLGSLSRHTPIQKQHLEQLTGNW